MKYTTFTAFLLAFLLFSCKETPKTTDNAAAQAADSTANRGIGSAPTTPPDSLIVEVDSMGKVMLGNRSVTLDNLPKALVDSSNALKKTTGHAPTTITYKSRGAMMGIRGAVHDAIEEAQDSLKKMKK